MMSPEVVVHTQTLLFIYFFAFILHELEEVMTMEKWSKQNKILCQTCYPKTCLPLFRESSIWIQPRLLSR